MMNGCPRWSLLVVPLLAALGCSDPVPRPAQGNLTLSIQQLMGCPTPGKIYQVGNPGAPTEIDFGDPFIDGENGATIKCSVRGAGSFTFSGSIQARSKENDTVNLSMTNGVINADKTGTATLSVFTPGLGASYSSDMGTCQVTAIDVRAGALWAKINCPKISESSTATSCIVGTTTTFVLENCDGY